MRRMAFSHTIFYVEDVPASLNFFEKAFGIQTKFLHDSGFYAELETGAIILAFASDEMGSSNLPKGYQKSKKGELPLGCEVVLTVPDVESAYQKALKAGGKGIAPPEKKIWDQIVAYVQDPNGVLIELAQPIGLS